MTYDDPFRIAILVWTAFLFPAAMYFRIRSNAGGEKLDRSQEGVLIFLGLRLSGLPFFFGILAWLINPVWMAWAAMPLPDWLRWLGLAVCIAGGSLQLWAFATLGKNLTDTCVTRRDHTLVTSGPYRYIRHPFYLAFLFGVVGISLVMANWSILTGLVPFAFILARMPIEERKLFEAFGEEYRKYRSQTGAFVPGLGRGE